MRPLNLTRTANPAVSSLPTIASTLAAPTHHPAVECVTPEKAAQRFDQIIELPAEQRRGPLLQLLEALDQLDGEDKVCLHDQIAIASLALPDADAEALHTPLMRMLAHAHEGLSQDAREDVADGFGEILLLSASPRSDEFIVRLAVRLIHLASEMDVERLVAKCVDHIQRALKIHDQEQRALLIGQAAPATPGLMPAFRYDYLERLYKALPETPHLRLAAITAIEAQTDRLPANQQSMDFKRTVLNERCALALALAETETELPTERLLALSLNDNQPTDEQ